MTFILSSVSSNLSCPYSSRIQFMSDSRVGSLPLRVVWITSRGIACCLCHHFACRLRPHVQKFGGTTPPPCIHVQKASPIVGTSCDCRIRLRCCVGSQSSPHSSPFRHRS